MRTPRLALLAPLAAALLAPATSSAAEWFADAELGVVGASRNDVRIPGTSGTRFSLVDDLATQAAPYARGRVGVTVAERHILFGTWAPVRLEAHGVLAKDVTFYGATFAAGSPVTARYQFDTYRLTYRYAAVRARSLDLDVGGTALVRSAAISMQGTWYSQKTNVGFAPLLSFRMAWRFSEPFALVIDGDALAAPQGRAEDVLVGVEWAARPGVAVRAGYRVIEGGSDNDEVYNFALLHHAGVGLTVKL